MRRRAHDPELRCDFPELEAGAAGDTLGPVNHCQDQGLETRRRYDLAKLCREKGLGVGTL